MKKILYLFLTVSLIFSSCKKEEEDNTPTAVQGCTDSDATNYNSNATSDDGTCMYNIVGVWETTSAILNGTNILQGLDLIYVFENGNIGTETYDAAGNMTSYAIGPGVSSGTNVINWTGTLYNDDYPNGIDVYLNWNIDIMTDNNNMTWRFVDYPTASDTYVKTLVRSNTYLLSDWK